MERKKPLLIKGVQVNDDGSTTAKTFNIADVKPGEIRHEKLTDDQVARATELWSRIGGHCRPNSNLATWLEGFRRDMHPRIDDLGEDRRRL